MTYATFKTINKIMDNKVRINHLSDYLYNKEINGLHYLDFIPDGNIFCLVQPNQRTDHLSTTYLIELKNNAKSPNTIRAIGDDIKRFLDYLMIFEIPLETVDDLLQLIIGFIDYLSVIAVKRIKVKRSIEWSLLDFIPLNTINGGMYKIEPNEFGKKDVSTYGRMSDNLMYRIVANVIGYLQFLKDRTDKYSELKLNTIPIKYIDQGNVNSSTVKKKKKVTIYDIDYLFEKAGIKLNKEVGKRSVKPFTGPIPTVEEMQSIITYTNNISAINKLLVYTLRGFGIRAAELSNIRIIDYHIPDKLLSMNYHDAMLQIKEVRLGDLYFNRSINKWVCELVENNSEDTHFKSRIKTGSRQIPYAFEQEELTAIIYEAIRERILLMRANQTKEHGYLFISKMNKCRPMNNGTVYKIIKNLTEQLFKKSSINLTWIHPHTFRHYFATYSLRIKKTSLDDVSRMLGHSDTETTRITYIHYLDNNKPESTSEHMKNTFNNTQSGDSC
ncbi:phage integrase family protein [Cytobacillus firmus]|uniref:Phage integrase family protein n=2 Tax=Cytobacillus TaxID=2675230 RepID=A0A366JM67_CYTFI|nr:MULTISPECIES: tyrosine-type recombinase/integrase [Cytobacillus]RBP88978.1 phage integrase family protein [Cytobacillus firmus]TDX47169.1 phage integrase family protein [Cytobacillus oceanisediminis]